jgi:hypothetical protein
MTNEETYNPFAAVENGSQEKNRMALSGDLMSSYLQLCQAMFMKSMDEYTKVAYQYWFPLTRNQKLIDAGIVRWF